MLVETDVDLPETSATKKDNSIANHFPEIRSMGSVYLGPFRILINRLRVCGSFAQVYGVTKSNPAWLTSCSSLPTIQLYRYQDRLCAHPTRPTL